MRRERTGLSVVELLIVVAIVGVLAGLVAVALPRQGFAVGQAERILGTAIQFARFEAIKRNVDVEVVFAAGSVDAVVRVAGGGAELRRYALDPQGGRVAVKSAVPNGIVAFNRRGVAAAPVLRTVTLGIVGSDANDAVITVSGQGAVGRP